MKCQNLAVGAMLCATLAACGSDTTATTEPGGNTYLRFVNSSYQKNAATIVPRVVVGNAAYDTTFITYTAIPIDILIDSSNTTPSVIGLAPNSIAAGTTGPSPLLSAGAGYRSTAVGVHSFVARVNGSGTGPSFFTTPAHTQYLPQLFLTNSTYYTLYIAGVNPEQPTDGYTLAPSDAFGPYSGFPIIVDDPFTPGAIIRDGVKVLQARIRVSNFAPFLGTSGSSDYVNFYLTPGTAAADLSNLAPFLSYISFQSLSDYKDVKPGKYRLTAALGDGTVLYSDSLTLNSGAVHSVFLQNAMASYTRTIATRTTNPGTPSASVTTVDGFQQATYKLTDLLENQFTL